MAAAVRIFAYGGLVAIASNSTSGRPVTDSVHVLKQPYLAGEQLAASTASAVSSAVATGHDGAALLQVQVESGKMVHIEVNPPGRSATATAASPQFTGATIIEFGKSWTLSVLEAS
jgi:carbamoylphosphate synthase large subunit